VEATGSPLQYGQAGPLPSCKSYPKEGGLGGAEGRVVVWRDNNCTGASPDKDSTQPMVVDASAPPIFPIPSSQPTNDEQVVLRPAPLAQVKDTLPPPPLPPSRLDLPPQIAAILADIAKWHGANASAFHSASCTDLTLLPPHSVAHAWAYCMN